MTGRISALFLLALVAPAQATTVIVPDNYPTIQQALNSGADEVQVRDGTYGEDIVIDHVVSLLALEKEASEAGIPRLAFPAARSLHVAGPTQFPTTCLVRGFHLTGCVTVGGNAIIEDCKLDSGLTSNSPDVFLYMRGCQITGSVRFCPEVG